MLRRGYFQNGTRIIFQSVCYFLKGAKSNVWTEDYLQKGTGIVGKGMGLFNKSRL